MKKRSRFVLTEYFERFASSAVLLREAARTSRQWQTYAARMVFSGSLLGLLLLVMWMSVNAPGVDVANLAWLGRGIFVASSTVLLVMALLLAPLMTSAAIIEERQDGTLEMLILSKLRPAQIVVGKVLSRILLLLTIVFSAMPMMAMVISLGGVAPQAVVAVVIHTLILVVYVGSVGAVFGLFTRSAMLSMLAAGAVTVPVVVIVPIAYIMSTGYARDAAHFGLFAGAFVEDWSSPVAILSYAPSVLLVGIIGTRLFDHVVSNADIRETYSAETWKTKHVGIGFLVAFLGLSVLLPASFGDYALKGEQGLLGWLRVGTMALTWGWWTLALTLSTWLSVRIGVDVVAALDGVRSGNGKNSLRKTPRVWSNPVAWREASWRAWTRAGMPLLMAWVFAMLSIFQLGVWLLPGVLLGIGVLTVAVVLGFTIWLAVTSLQKEQHKKSLEVLLTTNLSSGAVLSGKALGVISTTIPILLLCFPLFVLGFPHYYLIFFGSSPSFLKAFVFGLLSWVWIFPVWGVAIWGSFFVVLRVPQKNSTVFMLVSLGILLGVPMVIGRVFDGMPVVVAACQLWVPPLAGATHPWQYLVAIGLWTCLWLVLVAVTTLRLRTWVGMAGVLLAVLSLPASGQEPQDGFVVVARPMGDGLVRSGHWAAVQVQVLNLGEDAEVQVGIIESSGLQAQTYVRPLQIPAQTRRDVTLLYRPNTSNKRRLVTVRSGDRSAQRAFQVEQVPDTDITIGVFGTDQLGIQGIRSTTRSSVPGPRPRAHADSRAVHVGLIEPGSWPKHSMAYQAFDQLVWPNPSPSKLDPTELHAVRDYVADGGHLVLTVTERWRELMDSELAEMLPVELTGTVEADGLSQTLLKLGGEPVKKRYPLVRATLRHEAHRRVFVRLQTDDGAPLFVTASYGLGTVSVFLMDPQGAPFARNVKPSKLWMKLLSLGRAIRAPVAATLHAVSVDPRGILADKILFSHHGDFRSSVFDWHDTAVREWLADIPGLAPLPVSWLAAFALIYLFVIGPLDYIVLRLLKRQPYTWISFPVTVVVFSGVAIFGTSSVKGKQAAVSTVEVVDLIPNSTLWRGDAWVGVFATRTTEISLATTIRNSLAQPHVDSGYAKNSVISAGFGPGQYHYSADTWTMAYGKISWVDEAPGEVLIEKVDGGWKVTNGLPFAFLDAEVVVPSSDLTVFSLGHLAPGETRVATTPDDPSGSIWEAEQLLFDSPSQTRGYLDPYAYDAVFVGLANRITPLSIEGVAPIYRDLTLLRAPYKAPVSGRKP